MLKAICMVSSVAGPNPDRYISYRGHVKEHVHAVPPRVIEKLSWKVLK
jgi:hypothetical protein